LLIYLSIFPDLIASDVFPKNIFKVNKGTVLVEKLLVCRDTFYTN